MNDRPLPEILIRGIPNANFLDDDGNPATALFLFNKDIPRDDNNREESVNWHDDENARKIAFEQKKEDQTLQFKSGIALLSKPELDRIIKTKSAENRLSYERRRLPENSYHGNLLLDKGTPKLVMQKIAASIATCAVLDVIKNPNTQ